jgi:signal peptidase I
MLKLVKIMGDSMSPDFEHGDFVLVSKIPFLFSSPRAGDVVLFRQPGYGVLIKRIHRIYPDGGMEVMGTQADSTDSRVFGPVNPATLIGKVIGHIRRR